MTYLPRRRLVLAGAGSASSDTQWPGSQLPWDAEDEFNENSTYEQCLSSQFAFNTQEPHANYLPTAPSQVQADIPTGQDRQFCSQLHQVTELSCPDSLADNKLEGLPIHSLSADSLAAVKSLNLSSEEYAELYSFLTKGSACVQTASAKERALYKLSDLRQVRCMVTCKARVSERLTR